MGVHDFDFLPGKWHVHNRKLVHPLDPSSDVWEEFDAESHAYAMLGGGGNHDHFFTAGYEGFSLRLYDPERDLWRIWWSSTARPGRLDPPVEGRFAGDGTATFETEDELDGIPHRLRFTWSEMTGDSARWDQYFSFDDGATWHHNWTMLLTRTE
jgi:hypothetical protein